MTLSKQAELMVATIKVAIDPDSPFCGLVDLSGIFDEPISVQQEAFDALTDQDKRRLQDLYGPGEAD